MVQEYLTYNPNPQVLNMTSKNFMFGLRISQNNFTTNPYFNITVEQRNYYIDNDGKKVKDKRILKLIPCTKEHWSSFDGSYNFTNYLQQNNYDFLCPKINDVMTIQGMFNSDVFSFLKIFVSDCRNSTSLRNNEWNPVCASKQQADSTLKAEGVHSLSIIMTSSLINSQNDTSWNEYYLNDDHYFTFIPNTMIKSTNTFLRMYEMETDRGIWTSNQLQNEELFSYQTGDLQEKVEMNRNDGQYAILYIRRSPFTQVNNRRYQKFPEFMSGLGGFVQIVLIIFRQTIQITQHPYFLNNPCLYFNQRQELIKILKYNLLC